VRRITLPTSRHLYITPPEVAGPPVLLYVVPECPHCARQRAALAARGADVREIDLRARPEVIPELMKLTGGRRIVPVVVDGAEIRVAPDGGSPF
jgi:glutaredoxin